MGKPRDAMGWVETLERQDADFKRRVEEELATMHLEQQLVVLREGRGLSQAQLARVLGVSQQAIAKVESGEAKNLGLKTLVKHVLALGGRLEIAVRAPGSALNESLTVMLRAYMAHQTSGPRATRIRRTEVKR